MNLTKKTQQHNLGGPENVEYKTTYADSLRTSFSGIRKYEVLLKTHKTKTPWFACVL